MKLILWKVLYYDFQLGLLHLIYESDYDYIT